MPKLKYNEEKETFTLKGLDICHLELIRSILYITRLGSGELYKESAFDLIHATDEFLGDDNWWEDCKISHTLSVDEGLVLEVNYEPESGCNGSCAGCKCS